MAFATSITIIITGTTGIIITTILTICVIDRTMVCSRPFRRWFWAGLGFALAVGSSWADVITPAQVPPAVQKAILAQLNGGTVGEINRDEEDGETTFTVEITKAGQGRDYTWSESGELMSMEVFPNEVPTVVTLAIGSVVGSGTIESIDKVLDDGEARYDVEWKTKDGASRSLSVLENGKVESIQVAPAEVPPVVMATITKEAGSDPIQEIIKSFEDDAVYFDVTISRGGQDRDFTVAESGKLESRQVFLGELSGQTRATVQRTIGGGKLLRIDQVFDKKKGVFPFEVESVIDGKSYDFSVGPKGAFLGVDE